MVFDPKKHRDQQDPYLGVVSDVPTLEPELGWSQKHMIWIDMASWHIRLNHLFVYIILYILNMYIYNVHICIYNYIYIMYIHIYIMYIYIYDRRFHRQPHELSTSEASWTTRTYSSEAQVLSLWLHGLLATFAYSGLHLGLDATAW